MKELFLISVILSETKTTPLFVTNDSTFGLNHFNKWKKEYGFENKLAKFERLPYIIEEKGEENGN
jgi:hypothetical protein